MSRRDAVGPEQIGPYRVLSEIGRGGMGIVYLAERNDGHFRQRVAIKVMRQGVDWPNARLRFERERQIVAALQHPNIARLLDGGLTADGRPYSAMEFVEGLPLDVYCDRHQLTLPQRLSLVETVAEAVHFAHRNLVVHRDIKPSNILVTEAGEVKLLDFGIAKLLAEVEAENDAAALTRTGTLPITPQYASPEQLQGAQMTTASDVYQLGLLLFELLTGQKGRDGSGSRGSGGGGPFGLGELRPPSRALTLLDEPHLAQVAADRGHSPKTLERSLRGDLDLIVAAALRPEPERRYASAADLAADLRHCRDGQPIQVGPESLVYRGSRFVRRHPLGVCVATLFLVLLAAYAVTVTVQARQLEKERDRAERLQAFALGIYESEDLDLEEDRELTAVELITFGADRARAELANEPDPLAEVQTHLADVFLQLGQYDQAEALYREVLAIRKQQYGESHVEVGEALNRLGRCLLWRDDPEAGDLLESALAQRRKYFGDESGQAASTLRSLGFHLRSLGLYEESEARFREALAIFRVGDFSPVDVAETLGGLAWTVRFDGRPEEAEPMLREALEIYLAEYGEVHSTVAAGWNNLASVLWQLEKWPEGDAAIERSIELKKTLYGDEHPDIALSLGNLAMSLVKRGDLDRAETVGREALARRQQLFGADHPRVAASLAMVAEIEHLRDRLAKAESLLLESEAIFRGHLPETHPSFGRVWRELGAVQMDLGRLEEARATLEAARGVYAPLSSSKWTWRVDVMLAEIDRRQGLRDDAVARLDLAEENLGDDGEWLQRIADERTALASP